MSEKIEIVWSRRPRMDDRFWIKHVDQYRKVKTCITCRRGLPLSSFYKQSKKCKGYQSECKQCLKNRSQRRIDRVRYGLNPEQAAEVRSYAECEVCGSTKKLSIDHDHATGHVRGLLCGNCNSAIGMVNDDVPRMLSLAEYILRSGFRSFNCPGDPERDAEKADGQQRIDDTSVGQECEPIGQNH